MSAVIASPRLDVAQLWDGLDPEQQRRVGIAAMAQIAGAIAAGNREQAPGFMAAHMEGENVLEDVLHTAAPDWLEQPAIPDLTPLGIEQCRGCGCTDAVGCEQGCGWAEPGLCTTCASGVRG